MIKAIKDWAVSTPERGMFLGLTVGLAIGTLVDWMIR